MVDVKKKRCAHRGCAKQPPHGLDDGSKKAEYCSQHAKDGVVNVKDKIRGVHHAASIRLGRRQQEIGVLFPARLEW